MNRDDLFALWNDRISKGEERLKPYVEEWEGYIKEYCRDPNDETELLEDRVNINYMFSISRTVIPSIYARNPEVYAMVRPRTHPMYGKITTELLNYQIGELKLKREARRAILDAFFCGIGWVKLGFAPALRRKQRKVLNLSGEELDIESALSEIFGEVPSEEQDQAENMAATQPFIRRVAPRYVIVDPLCTNMDDCRYIIHRILKTVDQVKRSDRYDKSATEFIQGTTSVSEAKTLLEVGSRGNISKEKTFADEDLVYVYEIWDRENNRLITMDSHNIKMYTGKLLGNSKKWPYKAEGYPFIPIVFNDDPDRLVGIPDMRVWRNPTQAMNFVNTFQYAHASRGARKFLLEKGLMDDDEIAKLEDGRDMAFAFVNGDPRSIVPLPDAPMSPDIYNLREVLRYELNNMSGLTENRKGGAGDKTATEATIIESRSQVRDNDRVNQVEDFILNVVSYLHKLDQEFLSAEYVSFLTSDEAMLLWEEQSEEVLNADVQLTIRSGSGAFISKDMLIQHLLALGREFGAAMDPLTGTPILNIRELVRRVVNLMLPEDPSGILFPPVPIGPLGAPNAATGAPSGAPSPPLSLGQQLAAQKGAGSSPATPLTLNPAGGM